MAPSAPKLPVSAVLEHHRSISHMSRKGALTDSGKAGCRIGIRPQAVCWCAKRAVSSAISEGGLNRFTRNKSWLQTKGCILGCIRFWPVACAKTFRNCGKATVEPVMVRRARLCAGRSGRPSDKFARATRPQKKTKVKKFGAPGPTRTGTPLGIRF